MDDVFAQPVGCGAIAGESAAMGKRPHLGPVVMYVVSITLGSVVTGAVLFAFGVALSDLSRYVAIAAMAALAAFAIGLELHGRISPLPEHRAQVPRRWTTWRRRWTTAAAFGFVLGTGAFTLLHHATIYVLAALIVLAPTPAAALGAAAVYGSTRGLLLLATWLRRGKAIIGIPPPERSFTRDGLAAIATLSLCAALFLVLFA